MLVMLLAAGHTALVVAPANAVEITVPSLDASFGTGGRVRYVAGPNPEPGAVAIDSAGRMVVSGAFHVDHRYKFYLARYTTAGRLDATFGVAES